MTKCLSLAILVAFSFCSGCKQMELRPQAETTPATSASTAPKVDFTGDQERFNYTEKNLGTLGKAVAALSANAQFKTLLYAEVEARFDGDDNALFEVVLEKCRAKGLHVADKANSFFSANGIKEDFGAAQRAFKAETADFEFTLFPQVYIPFYEELKEKGLLNKKPPVIVIFAGKEEITERVGSVLVDGKLTTLKEPVNETYAKNNEVWVISINETIRDGVIPKPQPKTSPGFPNGMWAYTPTSCDDNNPIRYDQYNIPRPPANAIDVRIGTMTVKCHKDNWLSGADDVEVLLTTGWVNQWDIVTYANQAGDPNKFYWWKSGTSVLERTYKKIAKIRRESINNQNPVYLDFSLMRHDVTIAYNTLYGLEYKTWPVYWSSGLDPNHPGAMYGSRVSDPRRNCLYFVIYEYDNTGKRSVSVTSEVVFPNARVNFGGINTNTYTFRDIPTEQSEYLASWCHYYKSDANGYMCGWSYEDGCIKLDMYTTRPQY